MTTPIITVDPLTKGLPPMPEFFQPVPYIDRQQSIKPGLNLFILSPMHKIYDEAETYVIADYIKTKFKEEKLLRYYDRTLKQYISLVPNIGTIYDQTMIWPLKAFQYFFAASWDNSRKYLEYVFGALEYIDPEDNKQKRVSMIEAYPGPFNLLINNGYTGTLMSQLVRWGSTNPTTVIANINGPTIDPTVAAVTGISQAFNIPVILWKDDVRMMYNARENPIVMAMQTNQTTIRNAPVPLTMPQNPSLMFSYTPTVALPIQKAIQGKNNVLLAPAFLEYLKKNLWYSLGNPFANQGANKFLNKPIPRDSYGKIELPKSLAYGKLLALGDLLLNTVNNKGETLQDAYSKFMDFDHSSLLWSVYMGKFQWEFMTQALSSFIYNPNPEIFWKNLSYYFGNLDTIDIHFVIQLIVEKEIKNENGKVVARYIPPERFQSL